MVMFFGKLVGTAVRHNMTLGLDMSSIFWRVLTRLSIDRGHLNSIDTLVVRHLQRVEEIGLACERDISNTTNNHDNGHLDGSNISGNSNSNSNSSSSSSGNSNVPLEWEDITFSTHLADGTKVNLIPQGEQISLNLTNWRDYITLLESKRLMESLTTLRLFREGMSGVLPIELLPIFTPIELQQIVSGNSLVDTKLLRACTEYEDIDPDSTLVSNFWEVLDEFSDEDKTQFLRFVWARSRMPASSQDLPMNFKLQAMHASEAVASPDGYMPHAQTCFFSLSLPKYTTKEILREKLLYAIYNSPNMDADVIMHTAEGWDN